FSTFNSKVKPILSKDSANREKYKVKTKFSTFNSKVKPILSKDSANREKYKVKYTHIKIPLHNHLHRGTGFIR
ncbi:hypothetical protein, partial [uncultured Bacteroides sp.]|uniref:hypothetical protein n=1 Tax=uncultured Bacteroides sp. TaxID=162156 RepID=UPI002621476F